MTNPPLQNWLQQLMSSDPLRAKSLVTTVFGDSIAPHGGAVWLGSLIELLAPFGISDRLVRTSVFRFVRSPDIVQAFRGFNRLVGKLYSFQAQIDKPFRSHRLVVQRADGIQNPCPLNFRFGLGFV